MLYIRQTKIKKIQKVKNKRVDKDIWGICKLKEGRGLNLDIWQSRINTQKLKKEKKNAKKDTL